MRSQLFKFAATAAVILGTSATANVFAQSTVLTDKAQMTVYTFDRDASGKSVCYGDCAAAWPVVGASSMPDGADTGSIARDDGTRQATYKGKPLYLFVGDHKPGDMMGENVQNVWHIVPLSEKVVRPTRSTAYSSGPSY